MNNVHTHGAPCFRRAWIRKLCRLQSFILAPFSDRKKCVFQFSFWFCSQIAVSATYMTSFRRLHRASRLTGKATVEASPLWCGWVSGGGVVMFNYLLLLGSPSPPLRRRKNTILVILVFVASVF